MYLEFMLVNFYLKIILENEISCYIVHRKYMPVLKKYPAKYIYEPWTAPRSVQQAAGCIIGKDYPRPIVDHKVIVKTNITRMKKARADHYGDSTNEGNSFIKYDVVPAPLYKYSSIVNFLDKSPNKASKQEKN